MIEQQASHFTLKLAEAKDYPYKASGPSQSCVQKWLRDIYGWHIIIIPVVTMHYTYKIMRVWKKNFDPEEELKIEIPPYNQVNAYDYDSYEQALEEGLKEMLNLI